MTCEKSWNFLPNPAVWNGTAKKTSGSAVVPSFPRPRKHRTKRQLELKPVNITTFTQKSFSIFVDDCVFPNIHRVTKKVSSNAQRFMISEKTLHQWRENPQEIPTFHEKNPRICRLFPQIVPGFSRDELNLEKMRVSYKKWRETSMNRKKKHQILPGLTND